MTTTSPARREFLASWLGVMGAFVLSRVIARLVGVTFDASTLDWYWQFLDVELLRERPVESILALHSQPPLFNAFLAVVLWWAPSNHAAAFAWTFMAMGMLLASALYLLLMEVGLAARPAAAVSALFMVSPACILYENFLFYEYPVLALSCVLALFAVRAMRGGMRSLLALFGIAAALVLLRSVFHVAWYAGLVAVVAWALPAAERRRAVILAAVICVVPATWYARNKVLHGFAGASSWLGMSLARMSVSSLPREEIARMQSDGTLSDLAGIEPFSPPDAYRAQLAAWTPSGIEALDRPLKRNGQPNYNHGAFVGISATYARDAMTTVWSHPGTYLGTVIKSWLIFAAPPSQLWALEPNRARLGAYDGMFAFLLSGQLARPTFQHVHLLGNTPPRAWSTVDLLRHAGAWALLGLPILLWMALRRAWQMRLDDRARAGAWLALSFHVAWVVLTGTLLETSENNRYQFLAQPFALALLVAVMVDRARTTTAGVPGTPPPP